MTEADWACGEPLRMLRCLATLARDRRLASPLSRPAVGRKLRLYYAGCARLCPDLPADGPAGRAVEVAERYADGRASRRELEAARRDADAAADAARQAVRGHTPDPGAWTRYVAVGLAHTALDVAKTLARDTIPPGGEPVEAGLRVGLLRDIFGNPFRPVPADRGWLTSAVIALARGMYESRDFSTMPVLADALQDAGCDNEDVLNHCRGDGPHLRGCWVVDLLTGRA